MKVEKYYLIGQPNLSTPHNCVKETISFYKDNIVFYYIYKCKLHTSLFALEDFVPF